MQHRPNNWPKANVNQSIVCPINLVFVAGLPLGLYCIKPFHLFSNWQHLATLDNRAMDWFTPDFSFKTSMCPEDNALLRIYNVEGSDCTWASGTCAKMVWKQNENDKMETKWRLLLEEWGCFSLLYLKFRLIVSMLPWKMCLTCFQTWSNFAVANHGMYFCMVDAHRVFF